MVYLLGVAVHDVPPPPSYLQIKVAPVYALWAVLGAFDLAGPES
jgi:hypothetical protein